MHGTRFKWFRSENLLVRNALMILMLVAAVGLLILIAYFYLDDIYLLKARMDLQAVAEDISVMELADKEKLETELSDNDIGLQVVNLTVQDAEPPTDLVMAAFKAVETAKQGKETTVNNAKRYRSEQIPEAEAEADRITQEAEGKKEARIAEAEGQTARFEKLYEEYIKNPLITRQRMFYEALEEILPKLKVVISDGELKAYMQIDETEEAAKTTSAASAAVREDLTQDIPAEAE